MTSGDLFANDQYLAQEQETGPVVCLGMTFENDDARRAYFTEELRKKLQDPDFRKIEGFPIGEDQDILNLSDPPYYTACPNPWIADFVAQWEAEKPEQPEGWSYHREPFAADVSEGKNHPIYNAHSYHTKVPHRAIMRYILHYTQPGDIVFDGFCGTGMTGVAAQLCGDKNEVIALGYQVKPDGTILQQVKGEDGKDTWQAFSKLGVRKAVLNDLSPAATFIAHNYNSPVDITAFEQEASRILQEVEEECGWMYETLHTDGKTKGTINYTVWSDVFVCPECTGDFVFWDEAVNHSSKKVEDPFACPHCSVQVKKNNAERVWLTRSDSKVGSPLRSAKQVPVLIVYKIPGSNQSFQKAPDVEDLLLLKKIDEMDFNEWYPIDELPAGSNTRQPLNSHGVKYVHQFYTRRNLYALALFNTKKNNPLIHFLFTSIACRSTQMNRIHVNNYFHGGGGWNAGYLKGTLYIPSIPIETSILEQVSDRMRSLVRAFNMLQKKERSIVETRSLTDLSLADNSLDYLFVDPPFGANINYSELNSIWESWLCVHTNALPEAIENVAQSKGAKEYRDLMASCFKEAYRVLKPGHWMTVEFSNTKSAVWNSIQTALTESGFIVANVSVLDKKQGSFKAVTTPTAVKQDLVISAYKPNGGFEERFKEQGETEQGVWDFVRTHLKYLPVTKMQSGTLQTIPERDPRILFDQVIAYYVRKGYSLPIDSQDFQLGLAQRFAERDGMFFLADQVAEYDRKKMLSGDVQQASLFVSDEASAIDWLRQLLRLKPQAFSDLNPQFMQQLGGWNKNEAHLDLRELLNQNFLSYDGKGPVPEQIHAYLSTNWKEMRNLAKDDPALIAKAKDRWYVADPNKAGDLEKLRERALLKEFEEYKQRQNKFKRSDKFRLEAIRAGFKKAWQERDYAVIIAVADKLPTSVLEEDPKLLMWYDQAVTRVGGE